MCVRAQFGFTVVFGFQIGTITSYWNTQVNLPEDQKYKVLGKRAAFLCHFM